MNCDWVDLLLENGEIISIECPTKFEDELHESLENAMKRKDWWSPSRFDKCTATYLGVSLDRVAMNKVVGIL